MGELLVRYTCSDHVLDRIERVLLPQLATVRFGVTDNRDQSFLGYACIPMASLRSGYRYIQLQHSKHPLAQLFVKLDIGIFTTAEHEDFAARIMNPIVGLQSGVALLRVV